jgi:hypothetical protein
MKGGRSIQPDEIVKHGGRWETVSKNGYAIPNANPLVCPVVQYARPSLRV